LVSEGYILLEGESYVAKGGLGAMQNNDRDALYTYIGRRIRALRLAKGLSQEQVAQAADISRPHMTNLEGGVRSIPVHTLYDVCMALEVEVIEVLPTIGEIKQHRFEPMEIGGTVLRLPPKAAKFIREMWESQ
jgi:transcriptional regulator with XRE-family HTH domain